MIAVAIILAIFALIAHGFGRTSNMTPERRKTPNNVLTEAKSVLGFAADLIAFEIGESEWNVEFKQKVWEAEGTVAQYESRETR